MPGTGLTAGAYAPPRSRVARRAVAAASVPLIVAGCVPGTRGGAVATAGAPRPSSAAAPWDSARAWQWFRTVRPVCGANYLPRTAVNDVEMWQAATFDPTTIDQELRWAQRAGYTSLRVFLPFAVWRADSAGFIRRFDQLLTIADRHGLTTMPVLFDDVAFAGREPALGPQPAPVPGVHNSRWVPSPGVSIARDIRQYCAPARRGAPASGAP